MLSLQAETQAGLSKSHHVFRDWSLGSSLGATTGATATTLALSLDDLVIKRVCDENHNNTIPFSVYHAQMASYSPIEDKMHVNESENLYSIFDGHGGDICSRFVVDRLPKQLMNSLRTRKHNCDNDYIITMKSSFSKVDEQFLNEHKLIVKTSAAGSCGVSVLVRNDTLIIGNVGDSRVLLGSRGASWSHELLTNDHNTKNEKERQLVQQRTSDPMPIRGHVTDQVAGERVGGVLMVTRAFGDGIFKRKDMSLAPFIPHLPYITVEPEVTIRKVSPTDKYVVISSDGLYEYLTPADVAATVEKHLETTNDGTKIAALLIEQQFEKVAKLAGKTVERMKSYPNRKEFMDDISIIVLIFNHSSPMIGRAAD